MIDDAADDGGVIFNIIASIWQLVIVLLLPVVYCCEVTATYFLIAQSAMSSMIEPGLWW